MRGQFFLPAHAVLRRQRSSRSPTPRHVLRQPAPIRLAALPGATETKQSFHRDLQSLGDVLEHKERRIRPTGDQVIVEGARHPALLDEALTGQARPFFNLQQRSRNPRQEEG